jgi:hypothetical protein
LTATDRGLFALPRENKDSHLDGGNLLLQHAEELPVEPASRLWFPADHWTTLIAFGLVIHATAFKVISRLPGYPSKFASERDAIIEAIEKAQRMVPNERFGNGCLAAANFAWPCDTATQTR